MAQQISSGAYSYVNYGFETTEGTVAGSFPRPFGQAVKITVNRKNNMDRIFGLGGRDATTNVAKKYEGTASVEFYLGAGDATIATGGASWLRAVLGISPTDGGATPYTHTYTTTITDVPKPFSIAHGIELGSADYVSALIGCKVNTCNITAAVDEVAKVKLECMYRTESLATSGIGSQVVPTEVPLTFANGTLSVAGTTIGYVQSVDLTITNNMELLWGLGSRYPTASVGKTRTFDLKMTVAFSDVSLLLEKFYGKASPIAATDLATLNPASVACVLTFQNSSTVDINQRAVIFTFANLYLNEHSLPSDVNEVIKEDVTGYALGLTTVVVKNATSTDVALP